MARIANYSRPKNTRHAPVQMLGYPGRHKWYMLVIALLVTASALASILDTYPLKPVINDYVISGNTPRLMEMPALMGLLYLCGTLAYPVYNQMIVHISRQVVSGVRANLLRYTQRLPLTYFDVHTHGELMSRFINDVDTISEALNSSFAVMIQSFTTITGTLIILPALNWRFSLIVIVFLAFTFLFIRYSGKRSKRYFVQQ